MTFADIMTVAGDFDWCGAVTAHPKYFLEPFPGPILLYSLN